MDLTREADLARLHRVLADPDETPLHKRQADKAMYRIKRKMHDRTLAAFRQRLIRADQAGDSAEARKIAEALKDYERRTYGRDD